MIYFDLSFKKINTPRLNNPRVFAFLDKKRSRKNPTSFFRVLGIYSAFTVLFFEVTIVKSLEGFAVTGFVARHFVNSVVDCVKVLLFRHARKFGFS